MFWKEFNINLNIYTKCFAIAVFVALIFNRFYFDDNNLDSVSDENTELTVAFMNDQSQTDINPVDGINYVELLFFENSSTFYMKHHNIDLFLVEEDSNKISYLNPYSPKTEKSKSFLNYMNYSDNYSIKFIGLEEVTNNDENKITNLSNIFILSSTFISMILPYLAMRQDKSVFSLIYFSPINNHLFLLTKYFLILLFYIIFCLTFIMVTDFDFNYIMLLSIIQYPLILFSIGSVILYKHKVLSFVSSACSSQAKL